MGIDNPKTWKYHGYVIEEDFESPSLSGGRVFLRTRTGYIIRNYEGGTRFNYEPGKYRTLAEAKRRVDEIITEIEEGRWTNGVR